MIGKKVPKIAMSLTYFSNLLDGWVGPDSTQAVLLAGTFVSEIAVGAGILLESKYKTCKDWLALLLVVGGIFVGMFFTLILFSHDEETIAAQRARIISLEKDLAPRKIDPDTRDAVVSKLKVLLPVKCSISVVEPLIDSTDAAPFAQSIRDVFKDAGVSLVQSKLVETGILSWTGPGIWLETSRSTNVPCALAIQKSFALADVFIGGQIKPEDLNDPEQVLIVVSSHPFEIRPVPEPLRARSH